MLTDKTTKQGGGKHEWLYKKKEGRSEGRERVGESEDRGRGEG